MVNLLLRSNPYGIVIIIALSLFVWLFPYPNIPDSYLFFNDILTAYAALPIGFVINFVAALILNRGLSKHFFSSERTTAFVLFYMLISSLASHSIFMLNWSILALSLSLFMQLVLNMGEQNKEVKHVFNASFFLGVLCLISVFFIPFIYLILIGIGAVRRVVFRDLLNIVLAMLVPLYLVLAFSYIGNNYSFLETVSIIYFKPPKVGLAFILANVVVFGCSIAGILLFKKNRVEFGAKILKVSNSLSYLYVISAGLTIIGLFYRDINTYFAWGAFANAIFTATLFLKIEFNYKEVLLTGYILFFIVVKYFI